jgi:membrane associated rhomboid family serine protease
MGLENRDYLREEERRYRGGGGGGGGFSGGGRNFGGPRFSGAPISLWLIIINFVVFVLTGILHGSANASAASPLNWGAFSVDEAVKGGQVWRFLTYQFLHGGFFHILFNMLAVFFFGPLVERHWGSRRFLAFYLLCGVGGAVVATALGPLPNVLPTNAILIGASGSVFGILVAAAVFFPRLEVQLLFPPIPMTMRTLAMIFLGIAAFSVLAGSQNAGGEAAHLGGALAGFVFAKFPRSLAWADRLNPDAIRDTRQALAVRQGQRLKQKEAATEEEVDRILAKVKTGGLQSLSNREKKTLNEATQRRRG